MAEIHLSAYLAEWAGRVFRYGESDCGTFVIGWLDRLTGRRGLDAWAGLYSDEASCNSFIVSNGGAHRIASEFLARHYGADYSVPMPGNAVVASMKGVEAMGLRVDHRSVAMMTVRGLLVSARPKVIAEWGIA